MGVILWLLIGAAAGWVANRMFDIRASPAQTVLIGMAGAVIGAFALKLILATLGLLAGLIGAVAGAFLVLWIWDRTSNR